MTATDQFLTRDEVAKILRVCPETITRRVASGQLPTPLRFGKRLLFDAEAIAEHLTRLRTGHIR